MADLQEENVEMRKKLSITAIFTLCILFIIIYKRDSSAIKLTWDIMEYIMTLIYKKRKPTISY